MMKKEYNEMMNRYALSDEARERIADALKKKAQERPKKISIMRIAAVAACALLLCVAGTVAAMEAFEVPKISDTQTGEDVSSFKVKAEVKLFELKGELTRLAADAENGNLRFSFATKEELEEYLGIKLADCAVLDGAGIVEDLEEDIKWGFDLYPALEKDTDARYVLSLYDENGDECKADPCVIKINSHRVVNNMKTYVEARIFTDKFDLSKLEEGIMGETFRPESYIISAVFVDEEGNVQYDAKNYYDAKYTFSTTEYEMKNGNTAMIVTAEKDMGVNPGHKEFIGYFVQDGVLYSVRPYAVYDPEKAINSVNGDEIFDIYEILDSVK